MSNTKTLISVVGPTAIGKTSLAIKLANHFDTEIISADSRQFFKEMSIGTAAPTLDELNQAKHHFIHNKSVFESYNVGTFEKEALKMLEYLFKHNDTVIMVGGSGLYVNALTKGLDDFPEVDSSIRETLNLQLINNGLETLQLQLKKLDIKSFETIEIANPKRVIRALEICIGSGKPYSSFLQKNKSSRNFKVITLGITADRDIIYDRINRRVDIMMGLGLLNEVKQLESYKMLNSLNTVGYKELFKYLDKEWTLDFAVSEIKKNSRRFAKRQLTWFKRNTETIWVDYKEDFKLVLDKIKSYETANK
ncbi:tRNA (adenosine(37)-N6)-dimethylallyltransferase MiaA [Aurantibacter sp.]|uniref:tRNA (adenosine(37)-N6)-dimethylallyltransferase MiaA n=1 Tax=Aurantibacter sp. TaxID=2807103 RepID=UPI0035C80EAC